MKKIDEDNDRFKELKALTKEQRKEIYDFAMKCSDEILSGLGINNKLDKICSVCNGKGSLPYDNDDCFECDGRKYELTEEGKILVEFIERHFRIEKR